MKESKPNPGLETIAAETLDTIDTISDTAQKTIDQAISPFRRSILQRFPVIFLLLVTLGVVATFLGLEQILLRHRFFIDNPIALFSMGVLILAVTGTMYKKLG